MELCNPNCCFVTRIILTFRVRINIVKLLHGNKILPAKYGNQMQCDDFLSGGQERSARKYVYVSPSLLRCIRSYLAVSSCAIMLLRLDVV